MSLGQKSEMTKEFTQEIPVLENQYNTDHILKRLLIRQLPAEILQKVQPDFLQLGEDAAQKLLKWSTQAELTEPILTTFDAWGKRIDHIQMCESWKNIEAYASEHGIVAAGYERQYGEWSRVYQLVLLYLFHPSSAFVSCPLAMTDGAAKLIETYGDQKLKSGAFRHLTSRDPKHFGPAANG